MVNIVIHMRFKIFFSRVPGVFGGDRYLHWKLFARIFPSNVCIGFWLLGNVLLIKGKTETEEREKGPLQSSKYKLFTYEKVGCVKKKILKELSSSNELNVGEMDNESEQNLSSKVKLS